MATTTGAARSGSAWAALRYPHFRWMFAALLVSSTGTMMQIAAVNWHVWELTRDELALGLVGLVRVAPVIVLSLLGGVVADAMDRRRLMLATQTGMLICSTILTLSVATGEPSLALIYLLTAAMAGLDAFDRPAWAALLPNLVPGGQVANAVRLHVLHVQITAVVGPVIAGFILGYLGPGAAYAANALSYAPVVAVLLLLRLPAIRSPQGGKISLQAMSEGLRFIQQRPILWATMLLDFFVTLFASALALLPIFASDILRVGEFGYGLLFAAPALGATLGAVAMAQFGQRIARQGELLLLAVAAFGAATVVFGLSTSFLLTLGALAVAGVAESVSMAIRGALRQLLTPDRLRGRVISANVIFYSGGRQLGEFRAGVLAHLGGAPFSVAIGGVATLIVVAIMAARIPVLRQYRELPAPVDELETAAVEPA